MKEVLITIAAACESWDFLVLERNVNLLFWKKKPYQILCLLCGSESLRKFRHSAGNRAGHEPGTPACVQGREWDWI